MSVLNAYHSSPVGGHVPMGLLTIVYLEVQILSVLNTYHSSPVGGHYNGILTEHKILQWGYYCPSILEDAHEFVKSCDCCQRDGAISKRKEHPLNPILVIELLDV